MDAPVVAWQAADLPFDGGAVLPCLYVIVRSDQRPDVAAFLEGWHGCGDRTGWEWDATTSSARVGVTLSHSCGIEDQLRVRLDVERDRDALDRLADTGTIVVSTGPWVEDGNDPAAAYAVPSATVRRVAQLARRGLLRQVAASN